MKVLPESELAQGWREGDSMVRSGLLLDNTEVQ